MMAPGTKGEMVMTKMRQPKWQFTIDAAAYGESWRWIHVDAQGVLRRSVTCFPGYDVCAASAKQHGWKGPMRPTVVRCSEASSAD